MRYPPRVLHRFPFLLRSRPWRLCLWFFFVLVGPGLQWAYAQDAFENVRYRLVVTYTPDTRTMHGRATLRGVWQGSQPLDALHFFLPPNTLQRRDPRESAGYSDLRYAAGFRAARLTVHHVVERPHRPLPFALRDDTTVPVGHVPDQAILHVPLPRAYQRGETWEVTITFTTTVPYAKNWGVYRGVLALDGRWYPMLVPHRRGAWLWGMQEFVHADYHVEVTTVAAEQVVASMPWSARTMHGASHTFVGSGGPFYHLGLSSSRRWHREEDVNHLPTLRVLLPPRDAKFAAPIMQTLRSVLAFYHQYFGLTLPEPILTVVVHERDQSWPYSAVTENLIFLSRDLVRVPALVRRLREYFLARALVRQWWGLRTAYNRNTDRWIGEGLATYLAFRWLDDTYGRKRNFLTWKGSWLPNFSYREQSVDLRYRRLAVRDADQHLTAPIDAAADMRSARHVYEKKGALIYAMLHDLLGAETFRDFVQIIVQRNNGTLISTADVRHAAEAASGKDLTWFFRQWVEQRVKLDYAVGAVATMPQTDASGQKVYVNRVEILRLGEAVMPLTVTLLASDGVVHEVQLDGTARREVVIWEHRAALSDVIIDREVRLPDIERLNNTSRVPYTVRPLIDFPRQDRYLIYPFVTLDNNFIDGYTGRLHLVGQYLDEQAVDLSVGIREKSDDPSFEGAILRRRFPHQAMSTSLSLTDRMSARTVTLATALVLRESHLQHHIPANRLHMGYRVSFLEDVDDFNGESVPDDFATSTGRLHSVILGYERDIRVPTVMGVPAGIIDEPLSYGYVLRLSGEIASEALGSNRRDFRQVRGEANAYIRLMNQTWLKLRIFGGWSDVEVPLQRKLSLAGVDKVRGYTFRLRLLGDRMLGGTVGLRFPLLRDIRLEEPWRYIGIRGLHLGPFVDGGWVWDADEDINDASLRSAVGLRVIIGLGFGSLMRFELAFDIAHPIDEHGRDEGEGVQFWVRVQATARGGLH